MRLFFKIPAGEYNYTHILLPNGSKKQIICYEGVIFLGIIKIHNHKYEVIAFIYEKRKYIYPRQYKTKTELHGAIQKLLQEEL